MTAPTVLRLGFAGFQPADLHEPEGLARLFAAFRAELALADASLASRYEAWLAGESLPAKAEADLLVALGLVNLLSELGRNVLTQATVHAICQSVYGFEIEEEIKKKYAPANSAGDPNPIPQS